MPTTVSIIRSLFLGVLLTALPASACPCELPVRPPSRAQLKESVRNSYDDATAVFLGEVTSADRFNVHFIIVTAWKGIEGTSAVLKTGAYVDGSDSIATSTCEYRFDVGKTFLVYASGPVDALTTDKCSRTAIVNKARHDIRVLNDLKHQ